MKKRVYSAEDVVLNVGGAEFPSIVDLDIKIPVSPRKSTRIRVCSLGDRHAARIGEVISRRVRLGDAWPLGLLSIDLSDHGHDVELTLRVKVRERDTGADAYINRGIMLPTHLGDDDVIKKIADLLEEMVLHEARESFFVDDALLRDPHANELTFRIKDLDHLVRDKE